MKDRLRQIILENEGDRDDIFSDVCNFIDQNKNDSIQGAITCAANVNLFLSKLIHGLANGSPNDIVEQEFREVQDHMLYLTKHMNEL